MKSLVLVAVVISVCNEACYSQTFNLVSSSNTVEYEYYGNSTLATDSDSDSDEVLFYGSVTYPDPFYSGYFKISHDLLARHGTDPNDPIVFVEAFSRCDLDIAGRLDPLGVTHEQGAWSSATYEVYGANPLAPVDLEITFRVAFEEVFNAFVVHAGSVTAGGEYWAGGAISDTAWYMMSPSNSIGVPYIWDTPANGVNVSFNLVVDPGSRITLTADAWDAMSGNTYQLGAGGSSFAYYYVWSRCFLEIL